MFYRLENKKFPVIKGNKLTIGDTVVYCLFLAGFEINEGIYNKLPKVMQKQFKLQENGANISYKTETPEAD